MINLKKENKHEKQIVISGNCYNLLEHLQKYLAHGYTFVAQVRHDFARTDNYLVILQKPDVTTL